MKNVAIYYPNGTTSYFEVGAKLLRRILFDQDKKETEVEVSSIVEKNNKIIVKFSDKSQIAYANLPFSTK
ncbi:MAG: hypothetical protein RBR14_05590, partial [Candidatus Cloacimonas acidaminovorans]|nr:hypothetical protein [Candidatus Cloacimonas acidaminovorans]